MKARDQQAEQEFLREVQEAFEQCCRSVIVHLDDDPNFDALLDGPLASSLDAYDRNKISSVEYVRRVYMVLSQDTYVKMHQRANVALWASLSESAPVLRYLHNWKNWNGSKKLGEERVVFELLSDLAK